MIVVNIGEQALWSWRGVIKNLLGGVIKKNFQGGAGGGSINFFIADFGVLGQKLVPRQPAKKIFSSRIFFSKKKVASLKSSKSGGRGSKAISEGVGVVLKARGGVIIFFFRGG